MMLLQHQQRAQRSNLNRQVQIAAQPNASEQRQRQHLPGGCLVRGTQQSFETATAGALQSAARPHVTMTNEGY